MKAHIYLLDHLPVHQAHLQVCLVLNQVVLGSASQIRDTIKAHLKK